MADVEVEVEVHGRTELALNVSDGTRAPVWIPKSQISDYVGSEDSPETIFIPEWLAIKSGLV